MGKFRNDIASVVRFEVKQMIFESVDHETHL